MHSFQPRILDQARTVLRCKHYSLRTEVSYLHWIRRFIRFHHEPHANAMGRPEIEAFPTHAVPVSFRENQGLIALPRGSRLRLVGRLRAVTPTAGDQAVTSRNHPK